MVCKCERVLNFGGHIKWYRETCEPSLALPRLNWYSGPLFQFNLKDIARSNAAGSMLIDPI